MTPALFMEVLRQLHTCVSKTFDNHFDNACRDLYQEFALRDMRVEAAEEATRLAEEARKKIIGEVVILKNEISLLREELNLNDIGSKEDDVIAERSLELEAMYAPHRIQEPTHAKAMDINCGDAETITRKYNALYYETQTLLKASGELRKQVKRHKNKLAYWRKNLDHDKFTLLLDGVAVDFQRLRKAADDHQTLPAPAMPVSRAESSRLVDLAMGETPPTPYNPNTSDNIPKENIRNKLGGSCDNSPATLSLEPISIQPGDTYGKEETAIIHRASNALCEESKQTYPSTEECAQSFPGCQDRCLIDNKTTTAQSILLGDESMPSSSLKTSSPHCRIVGTQDLDEVGNAVETPTKKRKHGDSQHIQGTFAALEVQHIGNQHHIYCRSPLKSSTVLQSANSSLRSNGPSKQLGKGSAKEPKKSSIYVISSITEDGDENLPEYDTGKHFDILGSETKSRPSGLNSIGQPTFQRLHSLLEGPLPAKQHLQSGLATNVTERFTGRDLSQTSDSGVGRHLTGTSEMLQGDSGSKVRSKTVATNLSPNREVEGIELDSVDKQLRDRPLNRLELNHFKINPNYNQGVDYAFSSVIRKRNERQCATGCTRLSCCGNKFHAMARLGGLPANLTSSKEKDQEDRRILEDYLGEEKHVLSWLDIKNQEHLLQEAKAKLIADRYGKHRHHHQRLGSPPGYWRTDMPDTQELQCDHQEAKNLERERVTDRYREAMRPGGLWKFADE